MGQGENNPLRDSLPLDNGHTSDEPGPLAASLPIEPYLAAIVAHELSNPFTAMAGRVDLMRNRKDLSAPLTRDLDSMRSAKDRIDRILTNLKAFSRRDTPPPRPVEIFPIVQSALERFRSSPAGQRTEVRLAHLDGSVRVLADPSRLEAVIAATLEVLSERSPEVGRFDLSLSVNEHDEEVSLMIHHDGPALTKEERDRVFHPFGGKTLSRWSGTITMAYGYYVIRAWGGTYRFGSEASSPVTELCLGLQI